MASTSVQTTQVDGAPPATQLAPPVAAMHPLDGAEGTSTTYSAREDDAVAHAGEAGQHRSDADEGSSTPPVEMVRCAAVCDAACPYVMERCTDSAHTQVHVKALIISGDSHVFSFEPETTVGRMVRVASFPHPPL
jgi:hypothetical protein